MTTRKSLLDQVEITSPCNANWEEMEGSNQIRYCSECQKYVYNISEMTRSEAELLVMTRRNQLCVRLSRDLDGNTLNVDRAPTVRLLGWRPGPVASSVLSALISMVPTTTALSQNQNAASTSGHALDESGHKPYRPAPGVASSAISGIVSDENGAARSAAVVTLTSEASGEVLSQLTSEEGEFRFDGLPARTYIVSVQAQGYRSARHHGVGLQNGEVRRLDVSLEKQISFMGSASIPAQPLRTLYLESDRVVVAQVTKSTRADKQSVTFKASVSVSQTIKGDGHKPSIDVHQLTYNLNRGFSEGETVLLFLQRSERERSHDDRDFYELIYGATSVKRLSASEMETYLVRLEALKAILNNPESDPVDTVEWLVRCAEDPITRREGAYELNMSALMERWRTQQADRNAAGDPLTTIPGKSRDKEPRFSTLLTGEQKERLMTALFKSEEFAYGDSELIDLVKRWNDPRLLPFLVNYIRRHAETAPYSLSAIMRTVAELLNDPKVNGLMSDYDENASYEDIQAEIVEEEDEDEESPDEDESADEDISSDEDELPKLTPEAAKQARTAMIKKFLEAAEARIKATVPQ